MQYSCLVLPGSFNSATQTRAPSSAGADCLQPLVLSPMCPAAAASGSLPAMTTFVRTGVGTAWPLPGEGNSQKPEAPGSPCPSGNFSWAQRSQASLPLVSLNFVHTCVAAQEPAHRGRSSWRGASLRPAQDGGAPSAGQTSSADSQLPSPIASEQNADFKRRKGATHSSGNEKPLQALGLC